MSGTIHQIKRAFWASGIFVAFLWGIHGTAWFLNLDLRFLGIVPRTLWSLPGILTAPLIHADWNHLMANTLPLFVLGGGLLLFYPRVAGRVLLLTWPLTGFWVWLAGHSGVHFGASGLVYSLAAFGVFSGFFRRDVASILVGFAVIFYYGGMFWGVFPGQEGVSWESHLFGALSGTIAAWRFRKIGLPPLKKYEWETEAESSAEDSAAPWNYKGQVTEIKIEHQDSAE